MTRPRSRSRWLAPLLVAAAWLQSLPASAETLTAEQAVGRAAARSPTLRAALLELAAARHAVAGEEGAREPVLVASVTGQYVETTGSGSGDVPKLNNSKSVGSSVALRYTTDVGTALEVGASTDATWRSVGGSGAGGAGAADPAGPTYTAGAYVSVRQPLLRGAGADSVLAPYAQAQASAVAA